MKNSYNVFINSYVNQKKKKEIVDHLREKNKYQYWKKLYNNVVRLFSTIVI